MFNLLADTRESVHSGLTEVAAGAEGEEREAIWATAHDIYRAFRGIPRER